MSSPAFHLVQHDIGGEALEVDQAAQNKPTRKNEQEQAAVRMRVPVRFKKGKEQTKCWRVITEPRTREESLGRRGDNHVSCGAIVAVLGGIRGAEEGLVASLLTQLTCAFRIRLN